MADFEFNSSVLKFKVDTDSSGYIKNASTLTPVAGTKEISFEYVGANLAADSAVELVTETLPSIFGWSADSLSLKRQETSVITYGDPVQASTKNPSDSETVPSTLGRFSTLEVVFQFANQTKGSFAVRPFNPTDISTTTFLNAVKTFPGSSLISNGANNSCTGIAAAYIITQNSTALIEAPESGSGASTGVNTVSIQVSINDNGTSKSKTFANVNEGASDTEVVEVFNALYDMTTTPLTGITEITRRPIEITE